MPSHPPKRRSKRRPAAARAPAQKTVRRSFALPAVLIEQVSEAVPPEHGVNPNAAVRHALEAYLERKRRDAFEREMDAMAADPWIRTVNAEIFREMEALDGEGLPPP